MKLPNPFPAITTTVSSQIQMVVPKPANTPKKFKRAGKQGTLIAMVLDESGSMASCLPATLTGFNEFVNGQKQSEDHAGAAYLTLVKFEGGRVSTLCENTPIQQAPTLDRSNYRPGGGTNLLDAIGSTLISINLHLSKIKKDQRPGVIVTIITDGEENSSTQYTNEDIKSMVSLAEASDWTFQFLGANIDAFSVGNNFGMKISNSVNYNVGNMAATMTAVSASTTRMRMAKMAGTDTNSIYASGLYTDQELKGMKED